MPQKAAVRLAVFAATKGCVHALHPAMNSFKDERSLQDSIRRFRYDRLMPYSILKSHHLNSITHDAFIPFLKISHNRLR